MLIRDATPADAESLLDIYRPYIESTPITFETEVPSVAEFRSRIETIQKTHLWLVAAHEEALLGYAYAGPFRTRRAYDWSLESAVYVRQGNQGQGIGRSLYQNLISRLKDRGVVNLIGGIALPNEASVRLHEAMGFKKVGHFPEIGFKMEKWWDVGFWQLQINKT